MSRLSNIVDSGALFRLRELLRKPGFAVVAFSIGSLALAVLADRELGTMEEAAFANGDVRSVRLRNCGGTKKMIANAAIAVGADVYTAAAGKVGGDGRPHDRPGTRHTLLATPACVL